MSFIDNSIIILWRMSVFLSNFLLIILISSLSVFIYMIIKRIVKKKRGKRQYLGICFSIALILISSGYFYYLFLNTFQFNDFGSDSMSYTINLENRQTAIGKIELNEIEKKHIHDMFINNKYKLTWNERVSYQITDTAVELWARDQEFQGNSIYMVLDVGGKVIVYNPSIETHIEFIEDNSDLYEFIYQIVSRER